MKKYRITLKIEAAQGTQSFYLFANSPTDALVLAERGEGVYECEDVEVTSLAEPTLDDIEEV